MVSSVTTSLHKYLCWVLLGNDVAINVTKILRYMLSWTQIMFCSYDCQLPVKFTHNRKEFPQNWIRHRLLIHLIGSHYSCTIASSTQMEKMFAITLAFNFVLWDKSFDSCSGILINCMSTFSRPITYSKTITLCNGRNYKTSLCCLVTFQHGDIKNLPCFCKDVKTYMKALSILLLTFLFLFDLRFFPSFV